VGVNSPADNPPETEGRRPPAKERLQRMYREYGPVALGVFAVLWVGALATIYTAVSMGWRPESAAGQTGTFAAAYLIFRLTLPFRIGATLVLTPIMAKVLEKLGLRQPAT
jgi:hypothetical protein